MTWSRSLRPKKMSSTRRTSTLRKTKRLSNNSSSSQISSSRRARFNMTERLPDMKKKSKLKKKRCSVSSRTGPADCRRRRRQPRQSTRLSATNWRKSQHVSLKSHLVQIRRLLFCPRSCKPLRKTMPSLWSLTSKRSKHSRGKMMILARITKSQLWVLLRT